MKVRGKKCGVRNRDDTLNQKVSLGEYAGEKSVYETLREQTLDFACLGRENEE